MIGAHGTRGPRGRGPSTGFTLVEATIVLMIVASAMAIVVPLVQGGLEAREVRRAARQIASTMLWCRGEAVSRGEPQELVIDVGRNTIHTTGWGRWAVLTEQAIIDDVQGGRVMGDGIVQILFFPNGATSGAEVVVASRRDPRERRLRIALDPLVGTVRVGDAV